MKNLPANQITMTSLELVDFINSEREEKAKAVGATFPSKGHAKLRHDQFLAKVPLVLGENHSPKFLGEYSDTTGRALPCYFLPKREACLMAMSYSYAIQAKVFDRMTELEEQSAASVPDFSNPAIAARAWADEYEAKNKAIAYTERQAKYINHLENLFIEGLTPVQFCKQLNGVNTSKVSAYLASAGWLFDENHNGRSLRWRVCSYARDRYLTEKSNTIARDVSDPFTAHTPILLKKGAIWIYRRYLKGELPMKSDWNGEFTHDKELTDHMMGRVA